MIFNIKKVTLIISLLLVCVLIFVAGGCDMSQNRQEKEVIIFINMMQDTLIEFNSENNAFELTVLGNVAVTQEEIDDLEENEEIFIRESPFGVDFIDKHVFPTRPWDDKPWFRLALHREEIRLSRRQSNEVWNLIENVIEYGTREYKSPDYHGHFGYVWAIIDGKTYWSHIWHDIIDDLFDPQNPLSASGDPYTNRELLLLVNALIDLSSIQWGVPISE